MHTKKIAIAAVSLALCLLLPFLTGQIPQIGQALAPMHIPVLLCSFMIGGPWAAAVGFIAPLLRSLLFASPPMMPMAVSMAFEMAAYGLIAGIVYRALPRKFWSIIVSLITAMILGRVVWGIARYVIGLLVGPLFSFEMFIAGAFVTALPGIILHLVLIPPIVLAMQKAKLIMD